MANEKILLKAEANKLGIDGYRTMSVEELQGAIKRAKGTGTKAAKGKTASTNGAAPAKGKTATKGKTSSAPAKGKSTSKKSEPAKATASKGKAKRAGTTKTTTAKGKTSTPAKGKAKKATPAKGKASASAKKTTTRKARAAAARVDIDRSKIDWRAESNVGRTGKRAEVMAALRKHKGNYDKAFDTLEGRAKSADFYRGHPNPYGMLRWLINRVAFDFVMATGQHTPGERAAYGTSEKPQDTRRRERRAEAAAEAAKAERAAKRAKGGKKAPAKKGKKK